MSPEAELAALLRTEKAGSLPGLIPGWRVAEIMRGLGLPWIGKADELWPVDQLAREIWRRASQRVETGCIIINPTIQPEGTAR